MEPLDLTFSAPLEAADRRRRTITGTVVPFGAFGNTSAGPAAFLEGAFGDLDASSVVLVREHDESAPLGRAEQLAANGDRMVGTFRVIETTAGDDALVEAAEGMRAGLSVGARALEYQHDDEGRLVVSAAELRHVGLVVRPAYETATVETVAANHHDQEHDSMPNATDNTATDRDDQGVEQLDDRIAAAVTAALDDRAERDELGVDAANPPDPAGGRRIEVVEPDIDAAQYARAVILAANGDSSARDTVHAALEQSGTAQHQGVVPVPLLGEIINSARTNRPTIDRLSSRELPAEGMSFELPRWQTRPTTAEGAEGSTIESTATVIDDLDVDVVRISGGNRVSVELIERSSPAYLDELIRELTRSFRQRSNAYAYGKIRDGRGTSTGADLGAAFTEAIGDSHTAAPSYVPNVAVGALDRWKEVRNATDDNGRKLYAASNPSNNQGAMAGTAIEGEVEGLRFGLETDATDGDLLVWPSEAVNYYEQPGAPVTVQVMQVSTLEWEVAVYGFLAVAPKHPTAVRQVEVGGTE